MKKKYFSLKALCCAKREVSHFFKMLKYKNIILILALSFLSCQEKKQDLPVKIKLNQNWQFKKKTDTNWKNAIVPGNVFSDLLALKEIPDPFILNNEEKVQWVSKTDWEYQTTFELSDEILSKKQIEINFNGIDTYSKIYLNDNLIASTKNAFVNYTKDIKKFAKQQNTLRIVFTSPDKIEATEQQKLGYELPEGPRIFTRKAQFQYGWDWGPKLNTMGIWKPVELVAWDDYKIRDIYIKQKELNTDFADLIIEVNDADSKNVLLKYEVYINDELQSISSEKSEIPVQIKNPKLWWTHNLGEPYLYDIKVVVKKGGTILDSISVKKGLRTIELITDKDEKGKQFYFKLNGKPIYSKGANYIPQHSFQDKVTSKNYEKLLSDVVKSNMNMLRVWGGGIYENDEFYQLCDEKGILIWQDFMFACAMYPGDKSFLENVQEEAKQQVRRLRNYASVALWCGNNENSEGWHRWGWQDGRSDTEKKEIWSNYLKVFDSILPKTVAKYSQTDYWESSPSFGRGNPKYEFEGDAHDWWVWHDGYPFEHFEQHVPRFMSEFGFQSFPSYEAIRYINQNDTISLKSDAMKTHQKHTRGFKLIDEYMQRDYKKPISDEDYAYVSQLVQAKGITMGIEAHRRAKPYNMGTLYWQLNDCWPVISWSSIDYFGNWKALQYKAKKAFENVLISSKISKNVVDTYVVNDKLHSVKGEFNIKYIDFYGKILFEDEVDISVKANSSEKIYTFKLNNFDKTNVVLVTEFNNQQSLFYLDKPKNLQLPKVNVKKEITKTKNGFSIRLTTDNLAKDVFLFTKEKGHFSDNFFDMLPNSTKIIEFEAKSKSLVDLKFKTLNRIE